MMVSSSIWSTLAGKEEAEKAGEQIIIFDNKQQIMNLSIMYL